MRVFIAAVAIAIPGVLASRNNGAIVSQLEYPCGAANTGVSGTTMGVARTNSPQECQKLCQESDGCIIANFWGKSCERFSKISKAFVKDASTVVFADCTTDCWSTGAIRKSKSTLIQNVNDPRICNAWCAQDRVACHHWGFDTATHECFNFTGHGENFPHTSFVTGRSLLCKNDDLPGFSTCGVTGYDSPEQDRGKYEETVSHPECLKLCRENDRNCSYVLYEGDSGYCHFRAGALKQPRKIENMTAYFTPAECRTNCYSKHLKYIAPVYQEGKVTSPQACHAFCHRNARCQKFSYNTKTGYCEHFGANAKETFDAHSLSGPSDWCTKPSNQESYSAVNALYESTSDFTESCSSHGKHIISGFGTLVTEIAKPKECRAACMKSSTCHAWSSLQGNCVLGEGGPVVGRDATALMFDEVPSAVYGTKSC